ncbi:hypothetical protein [Sporichthya sp.]|uniref:hypothetical protein n=1 Tax=Sporichthya sp. TaxID=65475 RepID=UPI0017CFF57D|nr:hypothetical protein [Sporichthya sp.]MBA3742508.1 hypothetical protein [Sporichthya sp.]
MSLPIPLTMAVTRVGAGVLTYANPELSAKVFGIKGDSSAYTARLFGSRDAALGLAVLSPNRSVRRNALRMGVVIDALDCAAAVMDAKRGKLTAAGSALLVGGAFAFAVLGVVALRESD